MNIIERGKWCYLIFFILMLLIIGNKCNLHVDEVYSYGLANQKGAISIQIEDGVKYSPSKSIFMNYMAVKSENRLDYINVWDNQEKDVHPPLYYVLLHTICSIFPGKYSVWFAGMINIVFAMLTLYMVRKIVSLLYEDNIIIHIVSISFILSAGILSVVSFLRMYMMAMYWITWMIFLFIDSVKELDRKKLIQMFIAITLGALTHYYCIVYVLFLSAIFFIYLLAKKMWDKIINFISIMVYAGLSAIIIFPAMIEHIFSGYRGTESLENLTNNTWSEYWERLKSFFSFIDKQIFGEIFGIVIFFCIFVGIFVFMTKSKENSIFENFELKEINLDKLIIWILLIVPAILYYLIISKIAVYMTDRYLFPIYAISLLSIILVIYEIIKRILKNEKMYLCVLVCCAIMTANSWNRMDWNYLYIPSQQLIDKAKEYESLDCLFVYKEPWKVQPAFYEVSNYNSVTFISTNNMDKIKNLDCISKTELILIIIGDAESILKKVLEECPMLTKYEKMGSFLYSTSYRLYGEGSSRQAMICTHDEQLKLGHEECENGSKNVCLQKDGSMVSCVYSKDSEYCSIWIGNKVLDITNAKYEVGTKVQLFTYNGTEAQKWRFQKNKDNSYTIVSIKDNFILAHDENGNIYLDENTGSLSTKWLVVE